MFFSSPLWLLGLAPWFALTLWFLWGLRHRVDVPFVQLWKSPQPQIHAKRGVEWPPPGLAAVLAAMLLGILAAAGPTLRVGSPPGPTVSIIVDRGISLSADKGQRYRAAIDTAAATLRQAMGDGVVELTVVPGLADRRTDRRSWAAIARELPVTAMDTGPQIQAAVARKLAQNRSAVILITDRAVAADDPRIIRLGPAAPAGNIAITRVAVHAGQVMVTLRNERSPAPAGSAATVIARCDGIEASRQAVPLPPPGESRDVFMNLSPPGGTVTAELVLSDDITVDNRLTVVSQGAWPTIEARTALSPELRRMVDSYSANRPTSAGSRRIVIAASTQELSADEPAVILAAGTGRSTGPADVRDHPVTAHVTQWPAAFAGDEVGWEPAVRVGGQMLVGVRQGPPRRVRVAGDMESWAASTDFVIFWANVFDWLGAGEPTYTSEPAGPIGTEWTALEPHEGLAAGLWPGVCRRNDGALKAIRAGSIGDFAPPTSNAEQALRQLRETRSAGESGYAAGPWLLLLATGLLMAGAALWRRGE